VAFKINPTIKLFTKDLTDRESRLSYRFLDGGKSSKAVHAHETANAIGIYVFALRKPGGLGGSTPWYIGKTEANTLGKEALTADKLRKYASALNASVGTPLLYFLTPKGAADRNRIDELEIFLIWLARQKNPHLINKKKVRLSPEALQDHLANLRIAGFLNSRGNPGSAAVDFKTMIGWRRTMHVSSDNV
jgi:hypothetical protein